MSKYQACLHLYLSVKYQISQFDIDVPWLFSALELVFFCVNALMLRKYVLCRYLTINKMPD